MVASSDGVEDCNAIDPGVFLDPNDGRLWLVYGSYFGYIRLVELDPKTGKRLNPNDQPRDLAINCEASDMIYHDGWYYLLATHGSCCRGADSGYNIRVGRAKKVTGPFLDNMGVDMIQGGGKLFVGSGGRVIGPGHFGLLDLGDGVQKFSLHYEADLDRGGASVLDIRPLLWKDGWPVAGENLKEGTYEIESVRTGTALELAVEGMPVGGRAARRGGGGAGRTRRRGSGGQRPPAVRRRRTRNVRRHGRVRFRRRMSREVSTNWPAGNIDVRMANYLCQAQQKWTITAVPNAGGYPGLAVFQDHDRRHGPRVGRHGGRRTRRRCPPSPARPNNCGESTSLPTARGASCRSRFRIPKNRWRFRRLAAVSRRSRNSIPRATNSAGC